MLTLRLDKASLPCASLIAVMLGGSPVAVPATGNPFILLEGGGSMLTEDGDNILTE